MRGLVHHSQENEKSWCSVAKREREREAGGRKRERKKAQRVRCDMRVPLKGQAAVGQVIDDYGDRKKKA